MKSTTPISSLICAVCAGYLPAPVIAQSELSVLEEVIVTAQRRAQNIQDVPIAITVLSEDFLFENDVRSLEDLNGTVPGFYATNSVNYGAAPLTIRGIGGANGGGNLFNDEPVAVYVDDVYISRLSFSTADLVDVDSIQVLRGPQGTLYGRNSTAGALLLHTSRPSDETEGFIRASIAQHGEKRVSGAISGALSKSLQGRLALGYSDRDGWGENTFDGSDIARSEDETVRLSLRYLPTDNFTADLILESQSREATPAIIAVANVAPGAPSTPFIRRSDLDDLLDDDEFSLNDRNENDSDTTSVTLLLNWTLGAFTLDSVTSVRDYELKGFQDSDGTQFTLFNNNGVIESEQWSQELRLASDDQKAFYWVVGAYYLQESADVQFTINNFQGLFGAGTSASFDAVQDLDSYALFGDFTWDVSDKLSLSVGGRFSSEQKDFDNTQIVTTIGSSFPLPIPFGPFPAGGIIPANLVFAAPPTFTSDDDFSDFTPRAVLNYQLSEDASVYISYSQGFKSGGFNSFGLAPAFASEEIEAFEIGVKSDLFNDTVRLNAAAFYYDYTDLQVRLPVPTGGVTIQNAGEAEVTGLEVELAWAPTSNLLIETNVTWLDTELNEFITQAIPEDLQFFIGAPIPLDDVNAKGNELTRAPEFQFFFSANYSFSIGETLEGKFGLNYVHQDSVFFLETNQSRDTFSSDDKDEVGVRLSVASSVGDWEVGLFGQNVTDERTITQVTALGGYPNAAVSEPSKWGIDFLYRF